MIDAIWVVHPHGFARHGHGPLDDIMYPRLFYDRRSETKPQKHIYNLDWRLH
jgi:hypothetical protein